MIPNILFEHKNWARKKLPAVAETCEIVDAAPAGWHVLGDVLRETCRGWDWFAMMIDVDLDEAVRRPHDVSWFHSVANDPGCVKTRFM